MHTVIMSLVRVFVAALLSTCLISTVSAGPCKKTNSVCVDGPSTKTFNGVAIYKACWQYKDTYECVDDANVNYCSAIEKVPGCVVVGATCTAKAWNGECLLTTKTYKCGDKPATTPVGTVRLDDSHTLIYNQIDHAPCDSLASNPNCKLATTTCVEGPETRVIDGLPVYQSCWKWSEQYSCVVNNVIDYCMPLEQKGCTVTSETCIEYAFTGACVKKRFNYACEDAVSPLPTNVIYLDTTYTITDEWDKAQCLPMEENANCTVAEKICTEPAGTRVINGQEVYKDCWNWHFEYTCASEALKSTCGDLQSNPACSLVESECIDYLPGGQCGLMEHEYKCVVNEGTPSTQIDCSAQKFCMDGTCFDTGYPPDSDFALAVATMEAMNEAASLAIFEGEKNRCTNTLFKSCCKSSGGGQAGSNESVATKIGVTGIKVAAEAVRVWGSPYVFEALVNSGSGMLENYAFNALADGWLNPTASMTFYGFTFELSGGAINYVGFSAPMLALQLAIMVATELMTCDEHSQALAMKRGQKLCHRVGKSYCSKKILGVCVEKSEGWCCFPSKLGRIINEQGRKQIGKSWGSAKHPNCKGFTIEELQQLDFSAMDLSEFIADIQSRIVVPDYAIERAPTNPVNVEAHP